MAWIITMVFSLCIYLFGIVSSSAMELISELTFRETGETEVPAEIAVLMKTVETGVTMETVKIGESVETVVICMNTQFTVHFYTL